RKAGYAKILGACRRARADGLTYVWCDTNCIDKRSSAELSEAINSMFAWYRDSAVCYAYLADVEAKRAGSLERSRWFTRGWTLQELLAPKQVVFFDLAWRYMGDRKELAGKISAITRIHIGALHDRSTIHDFSIAQRMSWAADRHTTREEDIAYCLLGIFDINMPLLYGEGLKAFRRLQEEIIKVSDDQSILAWELVDSSSSLQTGALAPSPNNFSSSGSIVRNMKGGRSPSSITNLGVSLKLPTISTLFDRMVLVGLNCSRELRGRAAARHTDEGEYRVHRFFQVWLWLRRVDGDIFERVHMPASRTFLELLYPDAAQWSVEEMFIAATVPEHISPADTLPYEWRSKSFQTSSTGLQLSVGFGTMQQRTRTYEDIAYPGRFRSIVLQPKGPSNLSHELFSSGSFSTLFSIAWDESGRPLEWRHTTFYDKDMEVSCRLSRQHEWQGVFGGSKQQTSKSNASLKSVHQRLGTTFKAPGNPTLPFIHMEKDALKDWHGEWEIAAVVVVQEPLQQVSPSAVSRILQPQSG
ncbi:HET-domain-containing protein, partial [Xylariomycetidae sp. FL2044]